MKKLLLLLSLLLLAPVACTGALINVDTDYRVTEVKPDERVFGIALLSDNPDETQNDVYFGDDSQCYREVHLRNGTLKEYKVSVDKFLKLLKKGAQVRLRGGRNWDGSIHALSLIHI